MYRFHTRDGFDGNPISLGKKRISTTLPDVTQLVQNSTNYRIYPITTEVILKAKEITDIPELYDRIIAATAVLLGLGLVSRDSVIGKSAFLTTIW